MNQRQGDTLERAEEYAKKLARSQRGGEFPYVGLGGRGVILAVLEEISAAERRVQQRIDQIVARLAAEHPE